MQSGNRYRLVIDNHSGHRDPVHLHTHSFEVTKIGAKPTSGVVKDTLGMPRFSSAEIDFVADNPGAANALRRSVEATAKRRHWQALVFFQ